MKVYKEGMQQRPSMERKPETTPKVRKQKEPDYMRALPKQIPPHTAGSCPYCHKDVNSIEAHIHDKHLGAKLPAKR